MMTWLGENPIPIALIGGLVTAVLAGGWFKTGERRLVYGAGAALLITFGLLALERWIVTDREQLERLILSVAGHVKAQRNDEAVRHLVPDPPEIRQRALGELKLYNVSQIAIKRPIRITLSPEEAPIAATAEFNVVVTGGDALGMIKDQRVPRFLKVRFEKIEEVWYVSDYEHHDPLYDMRRSE